LFFKIFRHLFFTQSIKKCEKKLYIGYKKIILEILKHLKLFEEFLNAQYESVETCKTREDCLKKFGKKLFAKKFSWLPWSEKNTNIEDKLIELIDKFTGHNHGKSTNPEFITLLKDYLIVCLSIHQF
jgi:hypothetical protein